MRMIKEQHLKDFGFWQGAIENAKKLTDEQMDSVEELFNSFEGLPFTETQINDIFWFEFNSILDYLGLPLED